MSTLIDLTGTISNDMWHYPAPFVSPAIHHKHVTAKWGPNKDFYVGELHMNTLTGTYFETPAHLFPKALSVDKWEVQNLVRIATVLKIHKKAGEAITLQDTQMQLRLQRKEIQAGDSLIFGTGWDAVWEDSERFVKESPYFDKELIEWLLVKGISFLAGDIPSFDNINAPQGFMHRLFKQGVTIAAPLINVISIPVSSVKLYVFPLKIKGACASPCRIICEY